jgi:OPT oligopeptide transporter protein
LHEKEKRPKGSLSRFQFFIVVLTLSFVYYIVPNFFFPSITALSFVCWIYKDSVLAQLLGSGLHGFGLGAIAFDWSTITAFLGSPLAIPTHVLVNSVAGFVLLFYVMCPVAYWKNAFLSQSFPYFSSDVFDKFGQPYNLTRILKTTGFELDVKAYEDYSKLYSGIVFVLSYGFIFASITSGLSQVLLFNGKYGYILNFLVCCTAIFCNIVHKRILSPVYCTYYLVLDQDRLTNTDLFSQVKAPF